MYRPCNISYLQRAYLIPEIFRADVQSDDDRSMWLMSLEKEQRVHLGTYIRTVLLAALSETTLLLAPCWERNIHVLGSWLQLIL